MSSDSNLPYHHGLYGSTYPALRSIGAFGALAGCATASIYCLFPLSQILDRAILGEALPNALHTLSSNSDNASIWTPGFLAVANLLTGAMIPASMAIEWVIYGQRPEGTICSTASKFRWALLWAQAKRLIPVSILFGAGLHFFRPPGWPVGALRPLAMSAAALLTTPIQAAAEEFAVRGLLTRISSSWFTNVDAAFWASTTIADVMFAAIHMSPSIANNIYYVIAGLCGTFITSWTGGLEATSLLHATSNVVLLVPILAANNISLLNEYTSGKSLGWMTLLPVANVISATWLIRQMTNLTAKQHDS